MERRFDSALEKALTACEVSAEVSVDLPKRFREYATPFGDVLASEATTRGPSESEGNRDATALRCLEYQGRGTPRKMPFASVEKWRERQPESRWRHVVVRDGSRGPLEVDVMTCRVQAKIDRRVGDEERLVVIRFVNGDSIQHDYYLTNADETVGVKEFARVSKLAHTIEEDFRNAKSEAGLADYQVRNWHGWHHHVTMALVTNWCLTQETLVQKKRSPK